MKTFLTSVKESSASGPSSRPSPRLLEAAERGRVADGGVRVDRQVAGLDAAGDPQRPADVARSRSSRTARSRCRWRARIASASSSNGITATTGPKISSVITRSSYELGVQHRGREPVARARPARGRGRRRERLPGRRRRRRRAARPRSAGPSRRSSSAGASTRTPFTAGSSSSMNRSNTLRCTRIRDRAQQSWPALSKTAYGAVGRRPLEVGVGEHDVRALAAQLQRHRLDLLGAAGHDPRCRPRSSR